MNSRNSRTAAHRLPPYARELLEARQRVGMDWVDVRLHVGTGSWERAARHGGGFKLCVPPDADWRRFDWRCVTDCDVVLFTWGEEWTRQRVKEFGAALIAAGARRVVAPRAGEAAGDLYFRPAVQAVAA